jgi:UDP-glucose 4-epimerase
MRVLLTGGAGFVGKELTHALRDDVDLLVVDALRYGTPGWLQQRPEGFEFRRVDIRDRGVIADVVAGFGPDVVVHLAAIHYIPECVADPALAVSTNVVGTVNLLAACPPGTRFVFASSGAVYKPDESPHREFESDVEPADIYGITKLQGETYVHALVAARGLSGCVVRLFNVIGPGETNPHLLPALMDQLRKGAEVIEVGNTWPKRDYIDVVDAARGFAAAALGDHPGPGECEVVNLSSGAQYSVDDIIERLHSTLGLKFEVRQSQDRMRAVDRPFLAADISRIKDKYGWSPQHSLDSSLERAWASRDSLPDFRCRSRW